MICYDTNEVNEIYHFKHKHNRFYTSENIKIQDILNTQ